MDYVRRAIADLREVERQVELLDELLTQSRPNLVNSIRAAAKFHLEGVGEHLGHQSIPEKFWEVIPSTFPRQRLIDCRKELAHERMDVSFAKVRRLIRGKIPKWAKELELGLAEYHRTLPPD